MSEKVILTREGEVANIVLNRPEAGNAVDPELMSELTASLGEAVSDSELGLLVLEGRGEHFCSGREPGRNKPERAEDWAAVLGQIVRVNELLQSFPGVTLSLVRGKAFGFGCGLAVQSDITIAADDARFAFPEINAGFPPTVVMSYLSRWMHRKKAFELVITGGELDAREAERHGLVNCVVPAARLDEEKGIWIAKLLRLEPEARRATKAFFRETAEWKAQEAAQYGVVRLANFLSSRD